MKLSLSSTITRITAACTLLLPFQSGQAETMPDGANLKNVKTHYNAMGDGVTDDTVAIRAAIADNIGKLSTLYFPNGTYVISDTLTWTTAGGLWANCLSLQGESRTGTIIKLKDALPQFIAPQKKAMIMTGTTNGDQPTVNTGGDEAFINSIYDMTIDTGADNTGAIGIDWLVHNRGVIRNVTIKTSDTQSRGAAGISMIRPWPGPGLIQDVSIHGFDCGIITSHSQYSITINKLTLQGQRTYGIDAGGASLAIEDLTSTNLIPAIRQGGGGHVVLINSRCLGGGAANYAVMLNHEKSRLFVRNLTTSGYSAARLIRNVPYPGANVDEFVWPRDIAPLFPSTRASLNLPIEASPTVFTTADLNQWCSVGQFGAISGDAQDDTAAIQAAMNSNKPIVYFPRPANPSAPPIYYISGTITVPRTVKRIIGFDAILEDFNWPANASAFRFEDNTATAADITTIERFWPKGSLQGGTWLHHADARTLYSRDMTLGGNNLGIGNAAGAGKLFADNCVATIFLGYPQKAWMRQINTEDISRSNTNSGGKLWILGLKTERSFVALTTTNGGSTELLGGFLMPGVGIATKPPGPLFSSSESSQSLIYSGYADSAIDEPDVHVRETRGGITKDLLSADVFQYPNVASISSVPLFCGHTLAGSNFFNQLYTGTRNNWNGQVGYAFTPTENVNVTGLGRAVSTAMNLSHTLRIWATNPPALVASATVDANSPTDPMGYKYAALPASVPLTANTTYRITSTETVGGDAFRNLGTISNHRFNATIGHGVYDASYTLYPQSQLGTAEQGYVPVTYYTAPPSTSPAGTNLFSLLYIGDKNNFTGQVGYIFTPNANITVKALGRAVSGSMNFNHTLRIWRSSDQSIVASSVVTASSPVDPLGYKYELLGTPVVLTAGTAYRITSTEEAGKDRFMNLGLLPAHDPSVTINSGIYSTSSTAFPTSVVGSANQGYVPVTFFW